MHPCNFCVMCMQLNVDVTEDNVENQVMTLINWQLLFGIDQGGSKGCCKQALLNLREIKHICINSHHCTICRIDTYESFGFFVNNTMCSALQDTYLHFPKLEIYIIKHTWPSWITSLYSNLWFQPPSGKKMRKYFQLKKNSKHLRVFRVLM